MNEENLVRIAQALLSVLLIIWVTITAVAGLLFAFWLVNDLFMVQLCGCCLAALGIVESFVLIATVTSITLFVTQEDPKICHFQREIAKKMEDF